MVVPAAHCNGASGWEEAACTRATPSGVASDGRKGGTKKKGKRRRDERAAASKDCLHTEVQPIQIRP